MDLRGTTFFHLHRLRKATGTMLSTWTARLMAWLKGVTVGAGLQCWGLPYFYRTPHSRITLGRGCTIWSDYRSNNVGSMSRSRLCTMTPTACIQIGDRVGMSAVTLTAHKQITIGDDTQIGAGSVIIDSDFHDLTTSDPTTRHSALGPIRPVTIGRNVFVGTRCLILKGVSIGDNAVIGAGSVVTHDIPAGAIAAGNPCQIIKHQTL